MTRARPRRALWLLLGALALTGGQGARPADAAEQCVLQVELDGVVHRAAADYLARAVRSADQGPCSALLVVIDTPGGALEATRAIAQTFMHARVPILTYVAPSGARAGSAGLFVVTAAHVAAMAPGTNIGAAHPVTLTGEDPEEAGGKQLARKIENDAAAFARAIGERRGRNTEWLEKAVIESAAATALEAKELDVIDHVEPSARSLLATVDGTTVVTQRGQVTLATAGARIVDFEPTIRERVFSVLGRPDVAYLLLMAGMLGLFLEFYAPGVFVAAAGGLFCLMLASIGLNLLPVDVGAIVLIIASVALFVAELYITSFGLLALAGVVTLVLGSSLLIDRTSPDFFAEPSVQVSLGLVIPLALVAALLAGGLAYHAARLRKRRPRTGTSELEGAVGRALTEVNAKQGWVQVLGERWQATSLRPLPKGSDVRVLTVHGLTLNVAPAEYGDAELHDAGGARKHGGAG